MGASASEGIDLFTIANRSMRGVGSSRKPGKGF